MKTTTMTRTQFGKAMAALYVEQGAPARDAAETDTDYIEYVAEEVAKSKWAMWAMATASPLPQS